MTLSINRFVRRVRLAVILVVGSGWVGSGSAADVSDLITNAVGAYQQGHYDLAVDEFSQLIRSGVREAYYGRARAYYQKQDYDRAIADLDVVIKRNPNAAALALRGHAYFKKADYAKAGADFSGAIQLKPHEPDLYVSRAEVFFYLGNGSSALGDYSQAIKLNSTNAQAFAHRGELYGAVKGDYRSGIADCMESIRLDPNGWLGYNNLAALLSVCPDAKLRDGRRALLNARKACELTGWKNPLTLSILAGAYAEIQDFPDAVNWQEKSMDMEMDQGTLEPSAQSRLNLYEHHKPFHAARN